MLRCRICGMHFPARQEPVFARHITRCYRRHEGELDALRTPQPFEGDPELAAFAAAEGDPYNRRPGTRRRPM
jgi:hypothetical protein